MGIMRYTTSSAFDKQFGKLSKKIRAKAILRLELFIENPFDPLLSNHALHGEWNSYRSINITSDIRAVYREIDDGIVYFAAIGTHSELYE